MSPPLIDGFGRVHDNLRVSVTDRCNIRCFYCMPADDPDYVDRNEILSFEEIERFARVAADLGVRKIRLTGGEPLVRRSLSELIRKLVAVPGIDDVALTTNGILLADQAEALLDAGLRRINVHVDTLDPARFFRIVRRPGLDRVLEGIERCRELGFSPIKLNAVAIRGVTEDDVVPLARFAREKDLELRFIEFMPLDADGAWQREKVLFASEILDAVAREIAPLEPLSGQNPRSPATRYRYTDGHPTPLGVIASVSRPFCRSCDRIRLTADGKIRNCLFALDEIDVKSVLRESSDDRAVADAIRCSVAAKWEGHAINAARFVQPPRPMHSIGG